MFEELGWDIDSLAVGIVMGTVNTDTHTYTLSITHTNTHSPSITHTNTHFLYHTQKHTHFEQTLDVIITRSTMSTCLDCFISTMSTCLDCFIFFSIFGVSIFEMFGFFHPHLGHYECFYSNLYTSQAASCWVEWLTIVQFFLRLVWYTFALAWRYELKGKHLHDGNGLAVCQQERNENKRKVWFFSFRWQNLHLLRSTTHKMNFLLWF